MDRLQAMTAFVRVVESGSFSAAARLMHLGQPAVSKAITQLERQLGVQLLLRSAHGLTPTDAGQRYFERVARIVSDTEEADAAARGSTASLQGRLRVAVPTTFGRLQIVPRLGLLLNQHPRLDIDVELDDRRVDLMAEGIDVAIRVGPLNDSTMIAKRLGRGRRSVLATPAYLASAQALETPEDLGLHQAIGYIRDSAAKYTFRRQEEEISVSLHTRLHLSAAEGIRAAVLADLGLTIAADWMFQPELACGTVVRCLTGWSLPPVDLWIVYPSGKLASAKARAFSDFITRIVEQIEAVAV
ncbi:LysR family transcriptional regulator [Acetobacter orleanensis]|uniref:LysR family transcriptional regulator n=1 Tax=Acetobacter orleanensis TaxID=104099 RepID=A0A4Y3TT48_9PROT|nr:LysR family transcriptional regulator [Acetobacter orleanensis]KXV66968.1 transcriptional regulator [Acetobacter orleanensis]PCD78335.1 LysR family transcriptional regulator [Acetobacter orleanensis]GAN69659.1 transcriptional regulator LysR [Acetobacter orleanensis JCM 7639]GBR28913.1 LysR family transcriptional regulator [Acetobacter orleanensis NRIC 0473]GEB84130.1 LysR family transcriptional regulator [Acetobacter orleanensis]